MVSHVKFSGQSGVVVVVFSFGRDIINPMGNYNERVCSDALLGYSQHDSVHVQQK